MIEVNNFCLQGVEYMIWASENAPVPGAEGIALLLDRQRGAGADRLLVVDRQRGIREFDGDGREQMIISTSACFAVASWYGRQGRAAEAAALLNRLGTAGRRQLLSSRVISFELHLTDSFCRQIMAAGSLLLSAAC